MCIAQCDPHDMHTHTHTPGVTYDMLVSKGTRAISGGPPLFTQQEDELQVRTTKIALYTRGKLHRMLGASSIWMVGADP